MQTLGLHAQPAEGQVGGSKYRLRQSHVNTRGGYSKSYSEKFGRFNELTQLVTSFGTLVRPWRESSHGIHGPQERNHSCHDKPYYRQDYIS